MLEKYPESLPAPLKADRAFQMVDPLVSTPFDSGQTRWDRQFTDVPTATPVSWIFSDAQCAVFRTWYQNRINLGADWFEMTMASDDGREVRECHFVKAYAGPERLGFNRWRISASLLLRRLPTIDPEWIELPEYWEPRGRAILDLALSRYWPIDPYDGTADGLVFDRAINEKWPEEA